MLKELYNYKELLKNNVKKDIRGKYKGSFLGILWSFINPLLSALVYAIVFPIILKNTQENYVTYLIIGILPWTFFVNVINQGTFCIVGNSGIIKKVYFPRAILPLSIVISGLINFLISCLIIFIFLFFSGIGFSIQILWVPLIILIQCIFSLGLILITSSINVYIRDAEYIINFIISILFYATPILYSSEMFIGTEFEWLSSINPMATIINSYKDIFYYQCSPDFKSLFIVFSFSLVLVLIGIKVFKKLEKGFAEEV